MEKRARDGRTDRVCDVGWMVLDVCTAYRSQGLG